jgi:hypothetical protein
VSKRETMLKHYLGRTGSFSTHGTKGGLNLLGWDTLYPENMTPEQERAAIVARIKQINGLCSNPDLPRNDRIVLGRMAAMLCKRANHIRPKIKFRGVEAFFCDVVREELGDSRYRLLMMHAKHRWARWVQEQELQQEAA